MSKCRDCRYVGMDMDMDPYCYHPEVRKEMPHGLYLYCGIKQCPPDEHPLFEPREKEDKI